MTKNIEIIKLKNVIKILKKRDPESNKSDYGMLTAVCGSSLYRGAASLAVGSALRCGVGIVRLASIEKVVASVAAKISGCIFLPLEESVSGSISAESAQSILSAAEKSTALLIGCGLINCSDTKAIVETLVKGCKCPMVLDADALNVLSENPNLIARADAVPIVTPHVGEMSRLTGKSIAEIKADPISTALEFSKKYSCITILKDSTTYIASPDGRVAANLEKNPGLAKGGSGDVLAGMVASLLAQGYDPYDAAVCAVKLHSAASVKTAERLSQYGMQPDDIICDLCKLFAEYGY